VSDDRKRLEEMFVAGSLLHPCAGAPSLVELARALALLNGVGSVADEGGVRALRNVIGQHEHYVFAVVDGLGMHLIDQLDSRAFVRRHFVMELRTVFPSSTAPALTSLATGQWPAQHAIAGWWTYLPHAEQTATILPYMERFSERPLPEADAVRAYRVPSLLQAYNSDVISVQPSYIANSVSSRYFAGGRGQRGYDSLTTAGETIVDHVAHASSPTFAYMYVPFVDTAQHETGPASSATSLALARVQARLERLHDALAGRARVIVTADHGQIAIERKTIITRDSELMRWLRFPPSGEPRVVYFHVRSGGRAGFDREFRQLVGDDWLLLASSDAFDAGLFGPESASAETRLRVGDFVALAPPGHVLLYEPSDTLLAMRGTHGGLTRDEMRIPLIVA
jgi:hypothetical protein